ncbi:hypothetical protein V8G54_002077 [Vigna mungo]|uniref:PH domain-containing protein n=1 Tax=Vigna mungo TaxID=3915 RepID=A0AAQ3P8L4_VIGMU
MFELVSEEKDNPVRSIHLKADRTSWSDSKRWSPSLYACKAFTQTTPTSLCGSPKSATFYHKTPSFLSSNYSKKSYPALPGHDNTCPHSQLQKLKPDPIAWIIRNLILHQCVLKQSFFPSSFTF